MSSVLGGSGDLVYVYTTKITTEMFNTVDSTSNTANQSLRETELLAAVGVGSTISRGSMAGYF